MSKSSTTTRQIPNPTPGEVLLLEFIEPMGLTQNGLARVRSGCRRDGSSRSSTASDRSPRIRNLRKLARYFGKSSEGFWLGLQADHDLLQRRREIAADLARIAPYRRAAHRLRSRKSCAELPPPRPVGDRHGPLKAQEHRWI